MEDYSTLDDKAIIEEILRRRSGPKQPGIPGEKVRLFLNNIGAEIERTGDFTKEYVDQLLRQLKNGEH
jgi:hypothetical protein